MYTNTNIMLSLKLNICTLKYVLNLICIIIINVMPINTHENNNIVIFLEQFSLQFPKMNY